MFNKYGSDKAPALQGLYDLMLAGKLNAEQKARKKMLRSQLRGAGMLSLPFSLNSKKFKAQE